ncbi:Mitogen-activated protein kinase kinase kinase YODA [Dichanthelium oligosanthes]|uniref:mitogen-activated protein kinase kinase kinase n=1 Tax=Dichanthelium oligosanthes TaxID=888268 RepID=A0A1E5VCF2_9POAL|nr:Mitogen-activated protein kinase kinase kinase YODA [Dichanthelium oligosanthes]
MRWWKRSASPSSSSHSSSASTPASPARASTSRLIGGWGSGTSSRRDGGVVSGEPQPRLSRARRTRYIVDDLDVGVAALGVDSPARRDAAAGFGLATVSSTPISRSPSNMEVAPARSSSTPVLLPHPLPLPDDGESSCRGPGRPLPSPTPRMVDGDWNVPPAEAPGVLETGSERMPPLIAQRVVAQTLSKTHEHNDFRLNGTTCGQRRKAFKEKFQDKNSAETLNFRLNIPAKSAPSSGFSSPVQSPRRLSNVDFSSAAISIQDTNAWSARSVWSSDLMGSSPPSASPDKFGQERSARSSPLRSPVLISRNPSAPPSPMHPKLFPENHVSRPEGNANASFHPLPLPPASVSPKLTNGSHQVVPKVELPSVAGQWQKGKLLGSGTFGCVYEATNRHTGALCAIKEVNIIPDDAKSVESLKQLEQEIKFLSQFKHDNIVQYYGSETFCSCRDIKGANLLVDINGVVKLADFGMAKHLSTAAPNLSLKGTPYWMAPEVVRATLDKSAGYDLAVDIWSLGCTIIEMFTGKPPWSGLEGPAAMFKVLRTDPPIPDNLSPEGKDFLKCCFKRIPAERPTASKLLEHPFIQNSNHYNHHIDHYNQHGSTPSFAAIKSPDTGHNGARDNVPWKSDSCMRGKHANGETSSARSSGSLAYRLTTPLPNLGTNSLSPPPLSSASSSGSAAHTPNSMHFSVAYRQPSPLPKPNGKEIINLVSH